MPLGHSINKVSRLTGSFTLRSGEISNQYFDKYRFESDPILLRQIATVMIKLLPTNTEYLAGLELGGVPIATAMSLKSGIPVVFVRKEAKTYGTCRAIEGADISNKNVCIIEDVITTGGAVIDAYQLLIDENARVNAIVCAIWRKIGPKIINGIDVFPALTLDDLK